ncbi:substrate-binding domain-containing protein [Streptomyces sp. NPDC006450]|uniref:substrate-binding domain-containing protein n=1 Tax=Streptomyces sp. NPDC006450 TaxID=3155458 RepID=UPI0033B5DD99
MRRPEPLCRSGARRPERASGCPAGLRIAELGDATTVFCAGERRAHGLLRALHEAVCSIPGDIGVVGFDGIPEAAYFTPPLTAVRQDCRRARPPGPDCSSRSRGCRAHPHPRTDLTRASAVPQRGPALRRWAGAAGHPTRG